MGIFVRWSLHKEGFMLEELIAIHQEVMATTPLTFKRYLYPKIHWDAAGLCLLGDRGVGKTTMLCQDLLERYQTPDRALYMSADNINVISRGLFNIAQYYYSHGGEALYIDEVHKYPNWSLEIKNILDTYKNRQVIFSASSLLDLNKSKGDLSRRVVYHRLLGLSFREFLFLSEKINLEVLSLQDILKHHVKIASGFKNIPILKHFQNYLRHGYYPFFLEGLEDYLAILQSATKLDLDLRESSRDSTIVNGSILEIWTHLRSLNPGALARSKFQLCGRLKYKVNNVIEKVLFEDVAVVYHLRQTTIPFLKRILWLVATSNGFIPNIDKMSKNLGLSREMVYNCLEYLSSSGLLNELFPSGGGNNLVRKPGKIYLNNANLLNAINGSLKLKTDSGIARETFFVNQVESTHKVSLHDKGDFIIDDQYVVEVGGKGKNAKQIKGEQEAYLAIDDSTIGFGKKIPLYLFGFLY